MHKVKERARPYLQQHLVNVTRPYKWSPNNNPKKLSTNEKKGGWWDVTQV